MTGTSRKNRAFLHDPARIWDAQTEINDIFDINNIKNGIGGLDAVTDKKECLPPLAGELFRDFSGYYSQWVSGQITAEVFREAMKMPKGVFYHYLKEYQQTLKNAIQTGEETTMASKKDFSRANIAPVYSTIADATAEAQEAPQTQGTQKKQRKPVEAYSPEKAAEMVAAGTTRGRKGCKLHRINMAFSDEVHEYIKTMARVRGESITEFTNYIFAKSMQDNAEIYEKAKAFKDSL